MAKAQSIQAEPEATLTVFSGESDPPSFAQWPAFPEEDVVSGNPDGHRGSVLYRDPSRRLSVGVWECPPSKFIEPYPGTEFGHVIAGSATLTNEETGESVTLRSGDHFFVAFGSRITWEVHETFRKVYTMYEEDWDPERFY